MMKKNAIKVCALILVVVLCIPPLLSGCGKKTLWIVTDAEPCTRRYAQIDSLIREFQSNHPEVEIEFERIPTEKEAQETMLGRIQTATMAGRGPDVFLPATPYARSTISNDNVPLYTEASSGLVFKDVQQAMRNGLFMDLSKYYDADEELGKEALVPAVMEAGVYDGRRYVLPLRFDLPIAYVDKTQFEAAGYSLDVFDSGLLGLMEAVAASGDQQMAKSCYIANIIRWSVFNFFPNFLDYENQKVLLTADELSGFINTHQKIRTLMGTKHTLVDYWSWLTYFLIGSHWSDADSMQLCRMENIICDVVISEAEGIDLSIIPLRAADGTLIADVTYYGAVGAGCDEPELAYEFLREFLLEDSQWESGNMSATLGEACMPGWPVRTVNAAQQMFSNQYSYWKKYVAGQQGFFRLKYLKQFEPTDDAIPDWHEEIDVARFSLPMEKVVGEVTWYATAAGYAQRVDPSIAGITDFANKIIEDLEWHLAEG